MLIIGGATATGKSTFAIMLAKLINGEIISADSMQVYRKMNIGTAKVTEEEKQGVVHHLIDVVEPYQEFSVAQYQQLATEAISKIKKRNRVPVIVGGTGLYINSLIYPLKFGNSYRDESLRKQLIEEANKYGNEFVHRKLKDIDVVASEKIHPNNVKRVIRAIEMMTLSGVSIAQMEDKSQSKPFFKMYAINTDRDILYARINKRVEEMFANGLLSEIDDLINSQNVTFSSQSMSGIGYKEFHNYYKGYCSLNDVKEAIKKHTRRYAKRQFTWFRGYKEDCNWINGPQNINIELCKKILKDYYENTANLE